MNDLALQNYGLVCMPGWFIDTSLICLGDSACAMRDFSDLAPGVVATCMDDVAHDVAGRRHWLSSRARARCTSSLELLTWQARKAPSGVPGRHSSSS